MGLITDVQTKDTGSLEPARLSPRDFTQQRNEASTELVRSLFWMNGGAALALLAFLQATWQANAGLVRYLVMSMGILCCGVLLAGAVHYFRQNASYAVQAKQPDVDRLIEMHRRAGLGSLLFFVVGVVVALVGAWQHLS